MSVLKFHRSDCSRVLAGLGAFVDGELREDRREPLDAHVRSCGTCSAELERLRTLRDRLRRSLVVSLPSQDAQRFLEGVDQRIQGAQARRWWTWDRVRELFWFHPKLRWALAAVLGTTVLLIAADLVIRPALPPPTPLAPTHVPPGTVVESVEGGPNNSVFLLSTPDQRLKIIWIVKREKS